MLTAALIAVTVCVAYWFWVRPILRQRPSLAAFWASEDSFFAALRLKFAGIKQKLTTAFVTIAGGVVLAHDQIAPLVTDTSQWAALVPSWAWPMIPIGITVLVQWFRSLADQRAAE